MAIRRAMDDIGRKYEENEYFLSELIIAGEIVKIVLTQLKPTCQDKASTEVATAVLATVRGDLHDLGKNIFVMLLQSSGFKIVDLGVDVSAETIIATIHDNNAKLLGLSTLLTTTVPELKNVVDKLNEVGLKSRVKVIIGGAAVNEDVARSYHVDAWGKTAVDGLKICQQWFGG